MWGTRLIIYKSTNTEILVSSYFKYIFTTIKALIIPHNLWMGETDNKLVLCYTIVYGTKYQACVCGVLFLVSSGCIVNNPNVHIV